MKNIKIIYDLHWGRALNLPSRWQRICPRWLIAYVCKTPEKGALTTAVSFSIKILEREHHDHILTFPYSHMKNMLNVVNRCQMC